MKKNSKSPSVFDVAEFFLQKAKNEASSGVLITHLKLQKLVYYAQAWHLVYFQKPLFNGVFQAWVHGPVNRELWGYFKSSGVEPLEPIQNVSMRFTDKQEALLNEIWSVYGKYNAKHLEQLTHNEEPWKSARGNCGPLDRCENTITNESMQTYYSSLLKENER